MLSASDTVYAYGNKKVEKPHLYPSWTKHILGIYQ